MGAGTPKTLFSPVGRTGLPTSCSKHYAARRPVGAHNFLGEEGNGSVPLCPRGRAVRAGADDLT